MPIFEKSKAECEKISEDETGKSKYMCRVEDKDFTVIVGSEGEVEITPSIILPSPRAYKEILKILREKGEKIVV